MDVFPGYAKPDQSDRQCPFCLGAGVYEKFYTDERFILSCMNCRLVFSPAVHIDGKFNGTFLKTVDNNFYQKKIYSWENDYINEKNLLLDKFKRRLQEIEKLQESGKILDIGCAAGFFLELAMIHGWNVFGIDTSPFMINYCKSELRLRQVFCGKLEDVKFKSNFFDVITVFDTLEHIQDLNSFLNKIHQLLKPTGFIAICVPDRQGWVSRLMGKHWFDYKRLQHKYFFSQQTLRMVLIKSGFQPFFGKKEIFYRCPTESIFTKFKRYYPNKLVNIFVKLLYKFTNTLKIETIPVPLEHIYVISKKKI